MKEMILRVVKCGDCFTVKSEKSEGGVLNKRTLVLQELGGKYEPTYVVSALGNLASIQFSEGDLVIATLRFQSRGCSRVNGQRFQPSAHKNSKTMKKNHNNNIKTTTFNAQVAVSKTESEMDYVQVLPDNPRVGMIEAFRGFGYGQMLSNGSFDFVRKVRHRGKPELKVEYGSLSFCTDGNDRVIFTVPAEMRADMPEILRKGIKKIINHLKKKGLSL